MLTEFDYYSPQSLEEAIVYLTRHKGEVGVLAGGTDLVNSIRQRVASPRYLLSLKRVSSLRYISLDQEAHKLRVGPMTTLAELSYSSLIAQIFPILAEAAGRVGSVQIRNRGTIGGNICNASPAADTLPALLVLQGNVRVTGAEGTRIVPLEQFFVGPGKTILRVDEILSEVQIPLPPEESAGIYLKQGIRKAMDIATVGVGVFVVFASAKRDLCEDIRIGLGSVAPTPIRESYSCAPMKTIDVKRLNFEKLNGLVPAVIQDSRTREVLMLGFMNEEALQKTLEEKRVTFWSRTKERLWEKGETSGHFLEVISVTPDCDDDSLLILVKPLGPVCHTGNHSCFQLTSSDEQGLEFFRELYSLIERRKREMPEGSYTVSLFRQGIDKIAKKIGEEAAEVIIASKNDSTQRIVEESADLLYHLVVLLVKKAVSLDDVIGELKRRDKPQPGQKP